MNSVTKLANLWLLQGFLWLPSSTLSSFPSSPGNWIFDETPLQTSTSPLPTPTPEPIAFCFWLLWSIPSPDHQNIPNCPIQWLISFLNLPHFSQHLAWGHSLETSYSLAFTQPLFPHYLAFFIASYCALGTRLCSVSRASTPARFFSFSKLQGDQFDSHKFIYHLITLKSLFLTLIPFQALDLKPTGQPHGIFCRHADYQNSTHLLLNTQAQFIPPTFSVSTNRNNSSWPLPFLTHLYNWSPSSGSADSLKSLACLFISSGAI